MAQECGFFNAQLVGEEYDRVYLAEQFAAYFASFIGNGVFGSSMQQLEVTVNNDMTTNVLSGQAWINGWWYRNTDVYTLSHSVADGILSRIDIVVLRWDHLARDMYLTVIEGTPSAKPVKPDIVRNADYYDLQLCTVSIPAGSIRITQAQITDTRLDNSVCGLVTGVVDQIDTTDLYNQFESYFDEFKQLSEGEFDTWFESIKGKLSGDIAGSLQNQIDKLSAQGAGGQEILQDQIDKLSVKVAGAQEILQNQIDKISAQGAGAHNSIYRGKNLGTSVTDKQWAAIHSGRFDDLYIGDYWVINRETWRIAAFDYFLYSGDSECTTHHAVIVPDECLYYAQLNSKNDTTGSYFAVKNRGVLASAEIAIKETFGTSHILSHRVYLTNAVANGKPTGGAWFDTICDLMNEEMVYGTGIFRPTSDGSTIPGNQRIEKSQLPLFAHEPSRINNRANYWLRDVVSASAFAFVATYGYAHAGLALNSFGVRPAFSIKS